jgi:hypothetical protein
MTVDQDEILTTDEVAKLLKILESRRRPDIAGSAKAAPRCSTRSVVTVDGGGARSWPGLTLTRMRSSDSWWARLCYERIKPVGKIDATSGPHAGVDIKRRLRISMAEVELDVLDARTSIDQQRSTGGTKIVRKDLQPSSFGRRIPHVTSPVAVPQVVTLAVREHEPSA